MSQVLKKYFDNIIFMQDFTETINKLIGEKIIDDPCVINEFLEIKPNGKNIKIIVFNNKWVLTHEKNLFIEEKRFVKYFNGFKKVHYLNDNQNSPFIFLIYRAIEIILKRKFDYNYIDFISKLIYFMETPINSKEMIKLKKITNIEKKKILTLGEFVHTSI